MKCVRCPFDWQQFSSVVSSRRTNCNNICIHNNTFSQKGDDCVYANPAKEAFSGICSVVVQTVNTQWKQWRPSQVPNSYWCCLHTAGKSPVLIMYSIICFKCIDPPHTEDLEWKTPSLNIFPMQWLLLVCNDCSLLTSWVHLCEIVWIMLLASVCILVSYKQLLKGEGLHARLVVSIGWLFFRLDLSMLVLPSVICLSNCI